MLSPTTKTRVALVHDESTDVVALISILDAGAIALAAEILPLGRAAEAARQSPNAIVLGADLNALESLAALRTAHRAAPLAPIIAVSPDTTLTVASRALNAGAAAFVSELDAPTALRPAIAAAIAGMVCVPQRARRLIAKPTFSYREREVLELMLAGMTNRQIANRLHLAESTAKGHLVTAFSKLGVRSRKEATATLMDPTEGLLATVLPPRRTSQAAEPRARALDLARHR